MAFKRSGVRLPLPPPISQVIVNKLVTLNYKQSVLSNYNPAYNTAYLILSLFWVVPVTSLACVDTSFAPQISAITVHSGAMIAACACALCIVNTHGLTHVVRRLAKNTLITIGV